MINAFLSYRHKKPAAIAARDELKTCCEKSELITLIYDERVTEENDSIVLFMEKLIDARCVFLFLDPDYFESSYTLFELICVNEQAGLDKGFIHPVRLTEKMVAYTRTSAKQFWKENLAIREKTVGLLEKTGRLNGIKADDYDAIWRRIDNAWSNLIEDSLDHLKSPVIENGKPNAKLHGFVENIIPAIEAVKNKKHASLLQAMNKQIKVVLENNGIPLQTFFAELKEYDDEGVLAESVSSVADFLTQDNDEVEVIDLLSALIRVVEEKKETLDVESDEWENCFNDAEQLAGWLLLRAIDPDWWFDNEHNLQANTQQGMLNQLALESKEFVEVVISRGVLQPARYRVNEHGEAEPFNKKHDLLMVYDASSKDAKETQVLRDIYLDICKRKPADGLSPEQLFEKIIRRAKNIKKNAKSKAIYYLISEETQRLLKTFEWYNQPKESFEGCLHFICCKSSDKDYEKSVSNEDQKDLLDQIAILLELNE